MNLEQLIKSMRRSVIKNVLAGVGILGMLGCATDYKVCGECADEWYYQNQDNQIIGPYKKCGATYEKETAWPPWCAVKTAAKNVYVSGNQEGTGWKYCEDNDSWGCVVGDWYYQGKDSKLTGPFQGCIKESLESTSKSWCATKAVIKNVYVYGGKEGTLWDYCKLTEVDVQDVRTGNGIDIIKVEEYVPESASNGCINKYFEDNDGDGYGNPYAWVCEQLPGYVKDNSDCDDKNAKVHTGTGCK